jgi:hypothetical protein
MARLLGNSQQIRLSLLLVLLAPVFAAPMCSQSTNANSISELKPTANMSSQESAQPPVPDPKAENSAPPSPEQLRQAEIEADTRELYRLSAELRAEVAKTYKESLSLTVMKKAEQIEALAKKLRVLMSREAATNN